MSEQNELILLLIENVAKLTSSVNEVLTRLGNEKVINKFYFNDYNISDSLIMGGEASLNANSGDNNAFTTRSKDATNTIAGNDNIADNNLEFYKNDVKRKLRLANNKNKSKFPTCLYNYEYFHHRRTFDNVVNGYIISTLSAYTNLARATFAMYAKRYYFRDETTFPLFSLAYKDAIDIFKCKRKIEISDFSNDMIHDYILLSNITECALKLNDDNVQTFLQNIVNIINDINSGANRTNDFEHVDDKQNDTPQRRSLMNMFWDLMHGRV